MPISGPSQAGGAAEQDAFACLHLPIIVINLDRSPDRLGQMRTEFERVGLGFERFPGVDGTSLPDTLKPYFCDASGKIVSPRRPGEIGCYASHLAVWQRIAAGDYGEAALVCEDDLGLPDDLDRLLARILASAPAGWDVIRLSSPNWRAAAPVADLGEGRSLVRYTRFPALSGATLVTRSGAAKLLRPGIRRVPVDMDLARPWAFGIDELGVLPPPVTQERGASLVVGLGGRVWESRRSRRARRLAGVLGPDRPRRLLYNLRRLGLRRWLSCWAVNAGLRFGRRGIGVPQ